jgi:signal transduction histidine kinase
MANTDRFGSAIDPGPNSGLGRLIDKPCERPAPFDEWTQLGLCGSRPGEALPVIAGPESAPRSQIEILDRMLARRQPNCDALSGSVQNNCPSSCSPAQSGFLLDTGVNSSMHRAKRNAPNCGTLWTDCDLTALKTVEAELRQKVKKQNEELRAALASRQKAVDAAQAKEQFFANMSHELRTPLNAILGFSEVLKEEMFGPLANDRYREYAEIIHKSGSHLLNLINDVLDMSKLGAGKLEMHFEPVDLLKVIGDCVCVVEQQAKQSDIRISINLYDGIEWLDADDKRLRQILLNLLSNAVKFTHAGGEIHVSAFRKGESIAISVSDTGVGINPADIPKVLEPYTQIDSDIGRKHDGTGLGLPLVKELAELHGGTLTIESAVDIGTTVTITLPKERALPARRTHCARPVATFTRSRPSGPTPR